MGLRPRGDGVRNDSISEETMSEQSTKSELLEVINQTWSDLNEIIDGLSEEQLLDPSAMNNGWSYKDIMAHITAWEMLAMDRINSAITGEPLKLKVIESDDFANDFNADVFEKNKDKSLTEILDDFNKAHSEFVAQIEGLDESVLPEKLPFDWAGNLTYQVLISANTHWHYNEHIEASEKWLAKQ